MHLKIVPVVHWFQVRNLVGSGVASSRAIGGRALREGLARSKDR